MIRIILIAGALAAPASAAPTVLTDLPVTQGLVEAVLGDDPVAGRLLDAEADPHHAALRPSQMQSIEDADLLVVIGGGLMPGLERILPGEKTLALAGDEGAGGHDPHLWLDPQAAAAWLDRIADRLSGLDDTDPGTFRDNAARGKAAIEGAAADARSRIAAAGGPRFLAAHDAWHRASEALGLNVVAAISDSHDAPPGARALEAVEDLVAQDGVDCLLVAPDDDMRQADRIAAAHGLPVIAVGLLGSEDGQGVERYTAVLDGIATAVEACAAARS